MTPLQERTVRQLWKGGATKKQIAEALGIGEASVKRCLDKAGAETKKRVAAVNARATGSSPDAVAVGLTVATGSVAGDIAMLEAELRELRQLAAVTEDPIERSRLSARIGDLTQKLARLRLADRKAETPARDRALHRAANAAADKLRALLAEAGVELGADDVTDDVTDDRSAAP